MLKNNKITIGLIQATVSDDIAVNMEKNAEMVKIAAKKGAKIICLQELYRTQYFPQQQKKSVAAFSETIPGESSRLFSEIARKFKVVIIIPVFEKSGNDFYNSAVVVDANGKLMNTYRKLHIPHDPLFYEKSYFKPGDLGVQIYKTKYANFSVLICYDQWFPELSRIAVLKGADILFYPTAIGRLKNEPNAWEGDWRDAWKTVQRAHAIANGVYVAVINRVGIEGDLNFWGSSFVCDSFGKIIKEASEDREEIMIADLDLGMNKKIRDGWGFLKNRRPDAYGLISRVTNQFKSDISLSESETPSKLGYHMPAEWEKHDAVWLAWPREITTFDRLDEVEEIYVRIVAAISKYENVNLIVKDHGTKARVMSLLEGSRVAAEKISFLLQDYSDVWMRDYGPIFVVNRNKRKLAMVHWIYNAYGAKYGELAKDTKIPEIINRKIKLDYFKPGFVLEGGSIDVNGKGTLLTTEQCLFNRKRNPELVKSEIEKYLMEYLGVRHIIWLKEGVAGDDTDGHIDDIARFVNPTTVLCAFEENSKDENYSITKKNYELLQKSKDQDGNPLKVIKLPMPGPVIRRKERLPASYANFYIGNSVVLVPVFGHKNDKKALDIIKKAFPEREVVGINCTDLVYGLGSIHCITQQQPAVNYSEKS